MILKIGMTIGRFCSKIMKDLFPRPISHKYTGILANAVKVAIQQECNVVTIDKHTKNIRNGLWIQCI